MNLKIYLLTFLATLLNLNADTISTEDLADFLNLKTFVLEAEGMDSESYTYRFVLTEKGEIKEIAGSREMRLSEIYEYPLVFKVILEREKGSINLFVKNSIIRSRAVIELPEEGIEFNIFPAKKKPVIEEGYFSWVLVAASQGNIITDSHFSFEGAEWAISFQLKPLE